MCQWGDSVWIDVLVIPSVSHTGREYRARKPIDRCLAELVRRLDAAGVRMAGSCCGHGRSVPSILLEDGSKLVRLRGGWMMEIPGKWSSASDPARRAGFETVLVSVPDNILEAL